MVAAVRLLGLFVLLAPATAGAVEGESLLSATPLVSSLTLTAQPHDVTGLGGGLAIDYQRGLSDTWWFRAAAGGALHDADEGRLWLGGATVGVTYAIDVLRYVPYAGIGLGLAVVGGPVDTAAKPYLELGIGLDVLQSRTWSWGVDARFSSFASGIAIFTIGPRITLRWGYF
jgi:hypothetical protein